MHKNRIGEYNSIGICKFGLNKILHTREAISLMNNNLPYNLIPKGFMGIFVINKTFKEVIEIASEKAVNFVINNILREEKYMLRGGKEETMGNENRETIQRMYR